MRSLTLLILIASTGWCSGHLSAQPQSGPLPPPETTLQAWPDNSSYGFPGSFEKVIAGNFLADGQTHVVGLRGGVPVFLYNPDIYKSVSLHPDLPFGGVFDLETYPDSPQDGVALTTVNGLSVVYLSQTLGPLAPNDKKSRSAPNDILLKSWKRAKHLAVGHLDSDGIADFAASDTSERLVLVGTGGVAALQTYTITAPQQIRDVQIGDYDGDGRNEIAVLMASSLRFYEFGETTPTRTWSATNDSLIATVPRNDKNGGVNGHVIAFASPVEGKWHLTAVDIIGRETPVQLNFEGVNLSPSAVVAADINHDNITDAVLTNFDDRRAHAVLGSVNTEAQIFSGAKFSWDLLDPPNVQTPNDAALPVFYQVDDYLTGPTYQEIQRTVGIFPMDSQQATATNAEYIPVANEPEGNGFLGGLLRDLISEINVTPIATGTDPVSEIEFVLHLPIEAVNSWGGVRLKVWRQDNPLAGLSYVDELAVHHSFNPFEQEVSGGPVQTEDWAVKFEVPEDLDWTDGMGSFLPHYYVHISLSDASGQESSRHQLIGFTLGDDQTTPDYASYLLAQPVLIDTGEVTSFFAPGPSFLGGVQIGTHVRIARIPDFTPGAYPSLPGAGTGGAFANP